MKRYKSFILFGALALSFAACNTDDLEQNIDALETRVQGVEAQVQALNNNMNVIRVLLDGNKTIQTATKAPDGTWTLLLSNGETLTLTPGNTDKTTYPVIEISDDGYWVIEGVKSEQRAKADDGKAADITPQFQIVEEGDDKVWQVSYDEGATWEYVTDETGAHVSATGTSAGTNPIAEAKVEGNNFKITLTDGGDYTIPIVKDLVCQITDPEDMENGKWYVDGTKSFTVTVSESADITARVVASAEWDATMTGSGAERTVSVTAPSTPSECILVVEVTKGVNTVTDEIVVRTNVTADGGYYADFMAGLDIQIGNVKVNRKDYEATYISSDGNITKPGIYFVAEGVSVNYTCVDNVTTLAIIGNNPSVKSKLSVDKQIRVNFGTGGQAGADNQLMCLQNLDIDANTVENYNNTNLTYILAQNGNGAFKSVVFKDCSIKMPQGTQPISYISTSGRSYENFIMENCKVNCTTSESQKYMLNLNQAVSDYPNVILRNNIFYCSADNGFINDFRLFGGPNGTISGKIIVENNTFINLGTFRNNGNYAYVYASEIGDIQASNNLFFADKSNDAVVYSMFRVTTQTTGSVSTHNAGYLANKSDANGWQMFYSNCGWTGAEEILQLSENPFDGGTYDLSNGTFIPNATYADYGATLE